MNLHLLSFYLDVASWIVIGLAVGYLVGKAEGNGMKYQYPMYLSVALTLGVFSTLHHALPEYGFALMSFIEVSIGTMLFAYAASQSFRKTMVG